MKKFVKKAILFALFFVLFTIVINGAFLALVMTTDWDFVKRMETLRFDDPDYELLALGTSLAQYGIDTELITSKGIKSYNMAYVGCSVKSNYVQLGEYLSKASRKPRYVILAMNSTLEHFNQEDIQPVIEFTMKGHKYNLKDMPISKFNWQLMELLKKALRSEYRATYVASGQKRSPMAGSDNTTHTDLILDVDQFKSARWVGQIAKTCEEHDIQFFMIEISAINETQNLSDIGPYSLQHDNGITINMYNLNSQDFCEFIDPDRDWIGMSHFNEVGAAKFTEELLGVINLEPL